MRRLKRMGRKFVSAALALTMTLGLVATGNIANITQVKAASALESNDFLKVNGTQIRKSKGSGDVVYLRGTNAGGWLVQENWINPT